MGGGCGVGLLVGGVVMVYILVWRSWGSHFPNRSSTAMFHNPNLIWSTHEMFDSYLKFTHIQNRE